MDIRLFCNNIAAHRAKATTQKENIIIINTPVEVLDDYEFCGNGMPWQNHSTHSLKQS